MYLSIPPLVSGSYISKWESGCIRHTPARTTHSGSCCLPTPFPFTQQKALQVFWHTACPKDVNQITCEAEQSSKHSKVQFSIMATLTFGFNSQVKTSCCKVILLAMSNNGSATILDARTGHLWKDGGCASPYQSSHVPPKLSSEFHQKTWSPATQGSFSTNCPSNETLENLTQLFMPLQLALLSCKWIVRRYS